MLQSYQQVVKIVDNWLFCGYFVFISCGKKYGFVMFILY